MRAVCRPGGVLGIGGHRIIGESEMDYRSGWHFLQIPGPTNVPGRILRAIARPTTDHRGPEFQRLTKDVLERLKAV